MEAGTLKVDGDIVIGIPSRDVLLVTGANNAAYMKTLKDTVHEVYETGDHLVSDKLFIYKHGKFELYSS